jgi:hypothetical protein
VRGTPAATPRPSFTRRLGAEAAADVDRGRRLLKGRRAGRRARTGCKGGKEGAVGSLGVAARPAAGAARVHFARGKGRGRRAVRDRGRWDMRVVGGDPADVQRRQSGPRRPRPQPSARPQPAARRRAQEPVAAAV